MNSNIRERAIIEATERYIKTEFESEGSGHDWWHIYRVWKMALHLSEKEGGNRFVIEIAALLHDLDDWKIRSEDQVSRSAKWLESLEIPKEVSQKILQIIDEVSFKGAGVKTPASSLEAKIVQDADRLDAIGAIGIARTFAYGGNKGRLLYDPSVSPENHDSFEAYKKTTAPTINHFYEKLLLLKDRMNTQTAIQIAHDRHRFMETFLDRFFQEWEGEI